MSDTKDTLDPKILRDQRTYRNYREIYGDDLLSKQIDLEIQSRSQGYSRFYRAHDRAKDVGEFSQSTIGTHVVNSFDRAVEAELAAWMERADRPGRRHSALAMCQHEKLDIGTIAFLGTKAIVNVVGMRDRKDRVTRQMVAFAIADRVHDELRFRMLQDERFMMMRRLLRQAKERELNRSRTKQLVQSQLKREELEWKHPDWSLPNRLKFGLMFLECFQNATGLLEYIDTYANSGKKHRDTLVYATEEFIEQVTSNIEAAALKENFWMPMVVPPVPWSQDHLFGGGYLTYNITPYSLVKKSKSGYLYDAGHSDVSGVIDAVNAVQETPWRINDFILEAAEWAFDRNEDLAGLPRSQDRETPQPPEAFFKDPEGPIAKQWRRDCWEVHQANRKARSQRLQVHMAFHAAKQYQEYDSFWFCYDLDSRGRMYPKTSSLNPGGSDLHKAMLEFSTSTPILSQEHVAWIYVHTANCAGKDKLPMDDRIAWVEDNLERIKLTGQDYRNDLWWATEMADDDPFQFLRACREIYLLHEHGGEGFQTTLPIAIDATNSGLQHYSAMTRDTRGGASVNLRDLGERRDIYGEVAEVVNKDLQRMVDEGGEHADIALAALDFGITRSICKRPVMIVPYSGTLRACDEYTDDFVRDAIEKGVDQPWPNRTAFSRFLARVIWDAIPQIVIKGREAMKYLTECASASVKADRKAPIQWTTPDNLVVQVDEPQSLEAKVTTTLDGRRLQVRYRTMGQQQDIRACRNATAPNYVHSMDACHLRMTVVDFLNCSRQWEGYHPSFAMVHDSFGVHATVMPDFARSVRRAFVNMYEGHDVLDQFGQSIREVVGDTVDLPIPPEYGDLDLTEVHNSLYFFS